MSGESQNPFSPRVMIAVILVGVFAFSGFALLGLYAGELRGETMAAPIPCRNRP